MTEDQTQAAAVLVLVQFVALNIFHNADDK